ncbi:uncharacterized protein LOC122519179 isoform X3 [Polistes fuscatus]|uniref:uncharacterized protein LOC122519179 isoform X3 n=1 Tax=Polistes fuscatus TaxID=30207 RepID=UPI001CA960F5|nr:uncharacterized protein LOC122519179 isoform X3 [Polistes fuscatus]
MEKEKEGGMKNALEKCLINHHFDANVSSLEIMEEQRSFGNYAISERALMKLETIKNALKDDICKADNRWTVIGNKKADNVDTDTEESDAMDIEESMDIMNATQLPSTQFYFTQVTRNHIKEDTEDKDDTALKICDIIEVLYEGLERNNGKLDFVHLENLSNNDLIKVFTDLGEKLSIKGIYNLCLSTKDINLEEGIKYMGLICTYVLLPKIIKLEESSRLIISGIGECVDKFPDEVLKFIFIPVLNIDLKDASIINFIVSAFQPAKRSVLILEYVENTKELKEWHISILEILLSVKVDQTLFDKLIRLLLGQAVFFSTNMKFSKLLLSFLKANTITSEEQKDLLREIIEVNETFLKRPIENILRKIPASGTSRIHSELYKYLYLIFLQSQDGLNL